MGRSERVEGGERAGQRDAQGQHEGDREGAAVRRERGGEGEGRGVRGRVPGPPGRIVAGLVHGQEAGYGGEAVRALRLGGPAPGVAPEAGQAQDDGAVPVGTAGDVAAVRGGPAAVPRVEGRQQDVGPDTGRVVVA